MDTITHAILGATLARATAPATTDSDRVGIKRRVSIGAIAAAFPDIDYLTVLIHPLAFIAEWHRSITHSLVMLPLWAIMLGFILARLFGAQQHLKVFIMICSLSLFSHILTDLITSWETQIFAPLWDYAPAWGLTFIIDPYFSAIIALALLIALLGHSRQTARIGIIILALYISLLGVFKLQAHDIGRAYAAQQNWPRTEIHTLPQPFAPFNWMVVVMADSQYHMALVNLMRKDSQSSPDGQQFLLQRLLRHYRPRDQLIWTDFPRAGTLPQAASAWSHPAFELYRKFAVLPYIYQHDDNQVETCTWFADLRFYLPELDSPFRYGMCKDHRANNWRLYQLTGKGPKMASRQPIPSE